MKAVVGTSKRNISPAIAGSNLLKWLDSIRFPRFAGIYTFFLFDKTPNAFNPEVKIHVVKCGFSWDIGLILRASFISKMPKMFSNSSFWKSIFSIKIKLNQQIWSSPALQTRKMRMFKSNKKKIRRLKIGLSYRDFWSVLEFVLSSKNPNRDCKLWYFDKKV